MKDVIWTAFASELEKNAAIGDALSRGMGRIRGAINPVRSRTYGLAVPPSGSRARLAMLLGLLASTGSLASLSQPSETPEMLAPGHHEY